MAFLEQGANRGSISTGYNIDNSLKLEADNTERMQRTLGTPTSTQIATISFWVKRTEMKAGNHMCWGGFAGAVATWAGFNDNCLRWISDVSNAGVFKANRRCQDMSAWYHIVWAFDTTQGTDTNRVKAYINGVQVTSWSTATYPNQNNVIGLYETNMSHYIGYEDSQSQSGYHAEYNFIDGQQLAPTAFGEFDSDSGIWVPKAYGGTYGDEGYYLNFDDSSSLGADSSGNSNSFGSLYGIAAADQATDTPTNNFCVLNAHISVGNQYGRYVSRVKHGATQPDEPTGSFGGNWGSHSFSKGKWYWEIKQYYPGASVNLQDFGVASCKNCSGPENQSSGFHTSEPLRGLYPDANTGIYPQAGSTSSYIGNTASSANDNLGPAVNGAIFQIAFDADDGKIWFGKNDTWQDTVGGTQPSKSDIAAGNNARYTSINSNAEGPWMPVFGMYNANEGHHMDVNFGGYTVTTPGSGETDSNGYGNFEYEPPSGFLAICSKNLGEEGVTTIDDPSAHFQVTTYTGGGTSSSVTNSGNSDLKPDLLWIKNRGAGYGSLIVDSSRGISYAQNSSNPPMLESSDTAADNSNQNWIATVNTNGWTAGVSEHTHSNSGSTFVAWQWKANGGTVSNNTDGDLTTSVQVNADAGFSIATYSPPNDTARTVGHGIGKKPEFIIIRARNRTENWHAYHSASGTGGFILDNNTTHNNNSTLGDALATSSVYKLGTDWRMNGSYNYVMWSWAAIEGYSIFGKYQGNGFFGTAGTYPEGKDGPFIHTGFKPALIIIKCDSTTGSWTMYDHKRDGYNGGNDAMFANSVTAEASNNISGNNIGIYSNGFKIHTADNTLNTSGEIYTYAAWAAQPQQTSTGIPCTAR